MIAHHQRPAHPIHGPSAAGLSTHAHAQATSSRADRPAAPSPVEVGGFAARLHVVNVKRSVRGQGVLQRNADKGDTCTFDLMPKAFEVMQACASVSRRST